MAGELPSVNGYDPEAKTFRGHSFDREQFLRDFRTDPFDANAIAMGATAQPHIPESARRFLDYASRILSHESVDPEQPIPSGDVKS